MTRTNAKNNGQNEYSWDCWFESLFSLPHFCQHLSFNGSEITIKKPPADPCSGLSRSAVVKFGKITTLYWNMNSCFIIFERCFLRYCIWLQDVRLSVYLNGYCVKSVILNLTCFNLFTFLFKIVTKKWPRVDLGRQSAQNCHFLWFNSWMNKRCNAAGGSLDIRGTPVSETHRMWKKEWRVQSYNVRAFYIYKWLFRKTEIKPQDFMALHTVSHLIGLDIIFFFNECVYIFFIYIFSNNYISNLNWNEWTMHTWLYQMV